MISKTESSNSERYGAGTTFTTAGNHQLRVELQCKPLGTRLTQELTTLFYGEEQVAGAPMTTETR